MHFSGERGPKSTQQFTAVGTYADGSSKDLTNTVVWSSTSNATIVGGGMATAVKPGNATITAALSGISGTASLTITNPLVSVAITPANPTITVGQKAQLTATGTYSDGTSSALTTGVAWNSSNSNVMSVDSTGLVQNLTAGRGVISASVGSISNSTSLIAVVSPTAVVARFAYVIGSDGTLSGYTVNTASGQIRANGYVLTGKNPSDVVVDPRGKFAFVTNSTDDTVSAYSIDGASGALTPVPGSPFPVAKAPKSVVADPSGTYLYVANSGSGSVSGFLIDSQSGVLSPLSGSPFACGSAPQSQITDPSGRFLYVTDPTTNALFAFAIGRTSGVLATVSGSPFTTGSVPTAVVVEPTGNFAYVANSGSMDVSGFRIDSSTGALTPVTGSPTPTGAGPGITGITTDPSGRSLYVANSNSGSISGFAISPKGGLTPIPGSPFAVDSPPQSIAIDPSGMFAMVPNFPGNEVETFAVDSVGALSPVRRMRTRPGAVALALQVGPTPIAYVPKFVYTANSFPDNVSAFTIDPTTGALTEVAGSPYPLPSSAPFWPFALVADPSNKFLYVANYFPSNNVSAFLIDAATGTLTNIAGSPFAASPAPTGIVAEPSGRFLYLGNGSIDGISAYSINASSGALSPVPGSATGAGLNIAVDPTGQFLFAPGVHFFRIDSLSGALTEIAGSPLPAGSEPSGIAVDPSGRFVYVSNQSYGEITEFTVDPATGALTHIGTLFPSKEPGVPVYITVEPTGRFAYTSNGQMFAIDQTSGLLTQINAPVRPPCSGGCTSSAVQFEPSGRFAYAGGSGVWAYTMDPVTGILTPIPSSPIGTAAAYTVTATGQTQ